MLGLLIVKNDFEIFAFKNHYYCFILKTEQYIINLSNKENKVTYLSKHVIIGHLVLINLFLILSSYVILTLYAGFASLL